MYKIDTLLQSVTQKEGDDRDLVIKCVRDVSGIVLDKSNIIFPSVKDIKRVKIITTGAQKTKLILVKNELSSKMKDFGFTIVGL